MRLPVNAADARPSQSEADHAEGTGPPPQLPKMTVFGPYMLNTYLLYLDLGRIQCISLYLEQEPPPTTLLRRNETQREYETDDDRSRIICPNPTIRV